MKLRIKNDLKPLATLGTVVALWILCTMVVWSVVVLFMEARR
jgi:hypothetical protein